MGLNASSDEWCCHSDRIVTGLPWAKKIVDDTIIWAPTLEELQERATIILKCCRNLNITISLKKLKRNNSRRAYHQSSWDQTRQQQVTGHCRASDANQRLSAENVPRLGKPAHGIRPGLGSHNSGTPTTTEKGNCLDLDRGHAEGI